MQYHQQHSKENPDTCIEFESNPEQKHIKPTNPQPLSQTEIGAILGTQSIGSPSLRPPSHSRYYCLFSARSDPSNSRGSRSLRRAPGTRAVLFEFDSPFVDETPCNAFEANQTEPLFSLLHTTSKPRGKLYLAGRNGAMIERGRKVQLVIHGDHYSYQIVEKGKLIMGGECWEACR